MTFAAPLSRAAVVARTLIVAIALTLAILPLDPPTIERWYSTGLYPPVQRALTSASNVVPIALLDVLCAGAAVALFRTWRRALRKADDPRPPRVRRAASATIVSAAAAYLAFLALWGLNYRRLPMAERLATGSEAPSTAQVVALGREVVARLNGMYGPAHAVGWTQPPWRSPSLQTAFNDVQRQLAAAPVATPGRLKPTIFGPFFRWAGVDGMVNPFGLEVLANPDLLPFERPFVTAHEWAHLAGYADEAEANFVGWLTAIRSDPPGQYSAWLYLYWQITGELPAAERQLLSRDLREGPRDDLAAIVARLRRGDLPFVRRATWMMYDSYLKANRVEEGVRSYGAVVSLILRTRFEDGWKPVRRSADAASHPLQGLAPTR